MAGLAGRLASRFRALTVQNRIISWRIRGSGLKTGLAWKELCSEKETRDVAELYEGLTEKFDSGMLVKASQLNKLLDNCNTAEDTQLATEAVRRFRKSLSKPRESIGSVFVRTFCRAGVPENALEVIQDKIQYGIFPTRSGFNMIMNEFLKVKDYDNAIKTFNQMQADEIKPSARSYHLVIHACCFQGTADGYKMALAFMEKSKKDSVKLLKRTYHCLAAAACRQGDPETCLDIVAGLRTQASIGLEIRALTMQCKYEDAVRKLVEIPSGFKTPVKSLEELIAAVETSGSESLLSSLQEALSKPK